MAGASSSGAGFEWGNKLAGTQCSYESMRYNGDVYRLHDCVFCRSGLDQPFIGKLMRLFEDEVGVRKVRIRWFFRPSELPRAVKKDFPSHIFNSKELFIGVGGSVKGVENENKVEVICGMAKVLCTARYGKNVMPSSTHMEKVDYFFNRAYDAKQQKVVKMANIENKHLGEMFVNKLEWLPKVEKVEAPELKLSNIGGSTPSSSMMDIVQEQSRTDSVTKPSKRSFHEVMATDINLPSKKLKGKEKIADWAYAETNGNLKITELDAFVNHSGSSFVQQPQCFIKA